MRFKRIITVIILVGMLFVPFCKTESKNTTDDDEGSISESIERKKVKYDALDFRDPFEVSIIVDSSIAAKEDKVKETKEKTPPDLVVQGLIWGGAFPQAIINNKVVSVGDNIDGARIIYIGKDGVIAFFQGEQYRFRSSSSN